MKTTITTLIIAILTIPALAAMDNPPMGFDLEDENYVNDIPFDTREVVLGLETELQDEAYIEDIPFNTMDVLLLEGIALEEEAEINDIDFSTEEVLASVGLELKPEENVNDIPFDTFDVLLLSGVMMEEESSVNDIPFDTECIVQSLDKTETNWVPCMIPFDGKTMELGTSANNLAPQKMTNRS